MADNQALSDDQLLAVAQAGDSSLLRKLTDEERQRLTTLQGQSQPRGGFASWLAPHVKPEVSAQANEAADTQAAMDERARTWPADVASRLPRWSGMQGPAGFALSAMGPAAQIAGVLASAPTALRTGRALNNAIAGGEGNDALLDPARAVGKQLVKKIGIDPDAMEKQIAQNELGAARMTRQAAAKRLRMARIQRQMAEAPAKEAAAKAEAQATAARQDPRLILTPEEVQAQEQLTRAYRPTARLEGMRSAARVRAGDPGVADPAVTPGSVRVASAPASAPTLSPRMQRVLDQLPPADRATAQALIAKGNDPQDVLALLARRASSPGEAAEK